jgi:hypothetical protein
MTDYTTMTNDELADAGRDWFAEVESRIPASSNAHKVAALLLVQKAHGLLNLVLTWAVEGGDVAPGAGQRSGGDPKVP